MIPHSLRQTGKFTLLPDFDKRTEPRSGTTETLDLKPIQGDQEFYFALRFRGYVEIDEDGLYRLSLTSDDGNGSLETLCFD